MDLYRPTFVHIHLNRLVENFNILRSFNPKNSFICPMIKANAYGHGDVAVAKALGSVGCQHLGVSSVEEGIGLRNSHVMEQILVFGFSGREAVNAMVEHKLTPVVSDFDQMSDIGRVVTTPLDIHLKFNSGMNRLGFQPSESQGVLNVLEKNENLVLKGMGTHFYNGAQITQENSSAWLQNREFGQIIDKFKQFTPLVHAYNSAAIAALYKVRKGFLYGFRPGLLAYGIDPDENLTLKPLVSPVMEFRSKIVSLQQVKSGEVVSYGGTWKATTNSLIGIVPAGYADGVCRSLSNQGFFLVRGKKVPIRGRVCMDYTMVDLTSLETPSQSLLGEDVVLIGKQGQEEITVEEVAKSAGRITYEIMTGISERVPRTYGVLP